MYHDSVSLQAAELSHLLLDKMAAISQTLFSNAFSWMKKYCILINISLKFVPKGPINNIPALVQIMAWCQIGAKPLSEPTMAWFPDSYMQQQGEMSNC